jgi:predicted metal-dependent hydrolase
VQYELRFVQPEAAPKSEREGLLRVGDRWVPLLLVLNRRARRYVLRLRRDGRARVTVPRGGTFTEARRFAESHVPWLERQLQRQAMQPACPQAWIPGTEIWFRGEVIRLEQEAQSDGRMAIRCGTEIIRFRELAGDLRPAIEKHLWALARHELPLRVLELARAHGISVQRIMVRNQRSRWGSCSRRGCISLNWRLIQAPDYVRDYLILHELAHTRQMNHSTRFWAEVSRLCPDYPRAELWLKQHVSLLR